VRKIAIFASGTGSNAEKIMDYFKDRPDVQVSKVYSNKSDALVIEKAKKRGINSFVFDRKDFYNSDVIIQDLKSELIDLIVLAGFLWLIPESLIIAFPNRIINIHPSLLPKYGGKGMYGINVHKAVSQSGDTESGITVHFVNREFDKGEIISQIKCLITPHDSPENIAAKVLKVEHEFFPLIIDQLLENKYFAE